MATHCRVIPTVCSLIFLFLSLHPLFALSSSPSPSPSPISHMAADSPSDTPESQSPATGISSPPSQSPSPSPEKQSLPPASDDELPLPSPTPTSSPDPSPAPEASDESAEVTDVREQNEGAGSEGMNGGKKTGVAIGVLIGACVVGLAGFVYKKRRDNIRRSQYAHAARIELI